MWWGKSLSTSQARRGQSSVVNTADIAAPAICRNHGDAFDLGNAIDAKHRASRNPTKGRVGGRASHELEDAGGRTHLDGVGCLMHRLIWQPESVLGLDDVIGVAYLRQRRGAGPRTTGPVPLVVGCRPPRRTELGPLPRTRRQSQADGYAPAPTPPIHRPGLLRPGAAGASRRHEPGSRSARRRPLRNASTRSDPSAY
jgi:hypothetical protein